MAAKKLLGKTQPRLWTRPLRPLTRYTSRGYEAIELAEAIGEPFLPWQKWLAVHAMEVLPGGDYRYQIVLVLVARQCGKSNFKRTISLHRLYIDGARLVLGVAQDVSLAREQWQMAIDTIEACPDLAGDLAKVRRVNGDEWFRVAQFADKDDDDREITYEDDERDESLTLTGGGRYKIAASNRKAGRGLSIDELTFDELREQRSWAAWSALSKTVMAIPNSQIWCMSNAGDDESVVLNQLRESALSGRNQRIGLFEWSGEDDCELDDWKQIAQAVPALGYLIDPGTIQTAIDTDPPGVYRTEVLCQKVDQLDGALNFARWKAGADPTGTLDAHRKQLAACIDVAPDGEHVTLAVAAPLGGGRARVEVVRAWGSSTEARRELKDLLAKIKPCAYGWFPDGPGGEFATILRPPPGREIDIKKAAPGRPASVELRGGRVPEICQEFAGLVKGGQVVHPSDPLLDAHVKGAAKLHTGDGWRFTRRGGGHVDAAYAAAGAVVIALMLPEPKVSRIRIIS